ncbi:MAG TPA: hypothetical protein VFL73_10010, partial [Solirubrobacteraceae bacterium]|nr:hypothetical protein [Solirubrobacteraceae bacterium]
MSRLTTYIIALLLLGVVPTATEAKTKKLPAPRVTSPADGATVEAFPAFTWNRVAHADRYQVQIAADNRFTSPV